MCQKEASEENEQIECMKMLWHSICIYSPYALRARGYHGNHILSSVTLIEFFIFMKNGLYQVKTSYLCAGFVVKDNWVTMCAPILIKKFHYWKTIAVRIGD